MLYQLVVYAISYRTQPQSSILYPTTHAKATEARIDVSDPNFGKFLGQVCLRPVHLPTIAELVTTLTSQGRREREAFAKRLAFGELPCPSRFAGLETRMAVPRCFSMT